MPRNIPRAKKRAARAKQPPNPLKVKIRQRKRDRKRAESYPFLVDYYPSAGDRTL